MTENQTVTAPAINDAVVARVLQIVDGSKGKISFAEAVAKVLDDAVAVEKVTPKAETPVPITDEHRAALARVVEVYGKVAPHTPRLLTAAEQRDIVDERQVIDTVLTLLAKRKDTSIRETIANHLDKVAEKDGVADKDTERDAKGHYVLKQSVPVPETSAALQRIVSEPKPSISNQLLHDLWQDGTLTREEYLSLTVVPEVQRVFDEDKARKAIKKDPALLAKIAKATTARAKTTTIKVGKSG